MPEHTHKQSIEAVIRAIELKANGASPEECDAAALAAIGVVQNSNSMLIAQLTDQTIAENLDGILAQLQNQAVQQVGPPTLLPPSQGQLPAGDSPTDADEIPF